MKVGFVGAGKVGFSLGKYLVENGVAVSGFYSKSAESSNEASVFTKTKQYHDLKKLVKDSDAIFITVPDRVIEKVWEEICQYPLQDKLICHFSGALSSGIFSNIAHTHAYGYSIHPLFAFHDRYESYKELNHTLFTIEGSSEKKDDVISLFESFGNPVVSIHTEEKVRYHAAAVMASNFCVGLIHRAEDMLQNCGFSSEEAHKALSPLILANMNHIVENGVVDALTGPIERNDITTVTKHLSSLHSEEEIVYRVLSNEVLRVARKKNNMLDYSEMERVLE